MLRWSKFLAVMLMSAAAANTYAVAPGFYLGLMGGYATNSGSTQQAQVQGVPTTTPVDPKSNQYGGRMYFGSKITPYFGLETGITGYSPIEYDTKGVTTCGSNKVQYGTWDVLGRVSLPVWRLEVFGKAGGAVVYEASSGDLNPDLTEPCGKTTYNTTVKPMGMIGIGMDLTQNWVADVSWTRTAVGGFAGNIDFYAFGVSYHFVDVYCGQFLCD